MWEWLMKMCCCGGKEVEINTDCEINCKCCIKKSKKNKKNKKIQITENKN